ncbi:DUF4102 domain-containing protein [bacterium]|nr:DUF4102 domain-containing protein [candidate division CSSED10-310 bacterium]
MYLEITPSDSRRWRLKYRFNGKEKLISLGVYPIVSLREARTQQDEARKLLAQGIDPSAQRQEEQRQRQIAEVNTFEAVAREWFGKQRPRWKESHPVTIIRRLEHDVFPTLGSRPIAGVTLPELPWVLRQVESREAVGTAHPGRLWILDSSCR